MSECQASPGAGVLQPEGLAPGEEAHHGAVCVLEEEGDGDTVGDGGGPGPGPVVTHQLQRLGQAALEHVLGLAVESGCEAVISDLHPTISDGPGSGAALHIVVKQEAAVRI